MNRFKKFIKNFFNRIIPPEVSIKKLSLSFSTGVFIAFSPFIGVHTLMIIIVCWVTGLNLAVTLATSYLINNPWTVLPIMAADYIFGHWLFTKVFNLDLSNYDPAWMEFVNNHIGKYLQQYLGLEKLCLWHFVIGGHILALILALISYPFAKRLFKGLIHETHSTK